MPQGSTGLLISTPDEFSACRRPNPSILGTGEDVRFPLVRSGCCAYAPLGSVPVSRQCSMAQSSACEVNEIWLLLQQLLWDCICALEEIAVSFALSFLMMTTAAALRLYCYATPLKGGRCNADPFLRGSRFVLHGAPIAFLFTAWLLLPTAYAMPPSSRTEHEEQFASLSQRLERLDSVHQLAQTYLDGLLANALGEVELDGFDPGLGLESDADVEPYTGDDRGPQRLGIRVFLLQRTDHYLLHWTVPGSSPGDILEHIAREVLNEEGDFALHEVCPQLPDDVLTVCVYPAWWANTSFVPAVIDASIVNGTPFMVRLPTRSGARDLLRAYGDVLPPRTAFYLRNDGRPFNDLEMRTITTGDLIRILPQQHVLVQMPGIGEALQDLYWARDFESSGLPRAPSPAGHALVIGPISQFVDDSFSERTVPEVHSLACNAFGMDEDFAMLVLCNDRIDDAAYMGQPYSSAWAVHPKVPSHWGNQWAGVFIDARDLGAGVLFHVFHDRTVGPEDVIDLIDVRPPDGYQALLVHGDEEPAAGRRAVATGSLLIVWLEKITSLGTPLEEEQDESIPTTSSEAAAPAADSRWRRPFDVVAAIYRLQHVAQHVRVSVIPEDDVDSLIEELLDGVLDAHGLFTLVPVVPQPAGDCLTFVTSTVWIDECGLVPALVDARACGEQCFAVMLHPTFNLDSIVQSFGIDWPRGAEAWVPLLGDVLTSGREILAQPGMLIVVQPSGTPSIELGLIDDKILRPATWVGNRTRDDLPAPLVRDDCIGLLGALSCGHIFPYQHVVTGPALKQSIREACGIVVEDFTLTTCRRPILDFAMRGVGLPLLIGVNFAHGPGHNTIFLDCRALGYTVDCIVVPESPVLLDTVLQTAGISRPPSRRLKVDGALLYTPGSEWLTLGTGSIIRIDVDTQFLPSSALSGAAGPPDDGPPGDGTGPEDDDGSDDSPASARSRSPRHLPNDRTSSNGSIQGGVSSNQTCKWNHGLQVDHVCLAHSQEDTSAFLNDLETVLDCVPRQEVSHVLDTAMKAMLCEYSIESTDAESVQGSPPLPIVISLSASLGPIEYNIDVERCGFPVLEHLQQLTLPWDGFILQDDISALPLHPSTRLGLGLCCSPQQAAWMTGHTTCQIYVDGSCKESAAAWSAVVIFQIPDMQQTIFAGVFGDALHGRGQPGYLGCEDKEALHAEQSALCFAALWIFQSYAAGYGAHEYQIHFDSTAAGFGASGQQTPPTGSSLSKATRGIVHALENYLQRPVTFRHVSAHEGHAWNEAADVVAKYCAGVVQAEVEVVICRPPPHVAELCCQTDWDWAWTFWDRGIGSVLPCVRDSQMSWTMQDGPSSLQPPDLVPIRPRWRLHDGMQPDIPMKIVSVNVQSILGKHRFIEEQLTCMGVQVVCMQETRSADGYCESPEFFRFASDVKSSWGVAIWIRKWFHTSGGRFFLQRTDFAQVLCGVRCIAVTAAVSGRHFLFVSVHLPQQGRDQRERDELLLQLDKLLTDHKHFELVVLGCDANARVPPDYHPVTGSVRYGDHDDAGVGFVQFLDGHDLFLPSTWDTIHHGDSATWRHARGSLSRIDFLAIGGSAGIQECASWVQQDFDLLNANDDHFPVLLQGVVVGESASSSEHVLQQGRVDRLKLLSPDGQATLRTAVAAYTPPDWNVHPDDHALHLQNFLQGVLHEHFSLSPARPRARYISDAAWFSRQKCNAFRKRTRNFKETVVPFACQAALLWWRGDADAAVGRACKCVLLRELFAAAVRFATSWVKSKIKLDRQAAIHSWLQSLRGLQGHKLLGALRGFGVGSRKKRRQRAPPPGVMSPDGCLLRGRLDLDTAWLRFFGDMEAGHVCGVSDFLSMAGQRTHPDTGDFHFELTALPTLQQVEAEFRRAPPGKAAGLDLLPPEVFKACPSSLARAYFPLYMKACLKLLHPVSWTGGVLFELYKGSGAHQLMENHRSIFLSSCAGKPLHRILRAKVTAEVGQTLDGLHCGSRPHAPVTLPALAIQLLCRLHQRRKHSFGVFFLDTKCAYYSVIREVAVGGLETDQQVEQLFHRFRLTGEDVAVLRDIIQQGGAFSSAGLGAHIAAIVRSAYSYTWFVSRHSSGDRLCHTLAGSRPGANFADLVFAFIYARILEKLRCVALDEQFALKLPFSGTRELWPRQPVSAACQIACVDASWADDTAAVAGSSDPEIMLQCVRRVAAVLMDGCRSFGLQPNLKRGKSALLLAVRGTGSRTCLARHFPNDQRHVMIPTNRGEDVPVFVEAHYVHLGAVLDKDGHLDAEARRRVGKLGSAFDSARKMLFQNKQVQFSDRVLLFHSLVTSTIFNLELWAGDSKAWRSLSRGYMLTARRLLSGLFSQDHFIRMDAGEVFFRTGLLSLEMLAVRKRLGFLTALVKTGCHRMWAILQQEGQWATQVADDLRWLVTWSSEPWPAVHADQWTQWWHILSDRPAWFKKTVKRAAVVAMKDANQKAAYRAFLRDCAIASLGKACARPFQLDDARWCCVPCGQFFQTGAGLGAHFKKCHGRTAAYRHYLDGSTCHGCGKQFFSSRRLALHLKVTPQCCDRMAAAGKRHDVAQPGIKTWKRSREDFVLCPPQRVASPLAAPQGVQRKWMDTPHMEEAFQAALDRMVWYEGSSLRCLAEGLFGVIRSFPFYTDEYRLIWQRLASSARHLVHDEELQIWQGLGPDALFQFLDEQAIGFLPSQLVQLPSAFDCKLSWSATQLFDALFWAQPRALSERRSGCQLVIGAWDQGTNVQSAAKHVSVIEALSLWFEDRWMSFGCICFRLSERVEEEALYSCRYLTASSLSHAPTSVLQARLLVCLREAECEGCEILLSAPCWFLQCPLALPFLGSGVCV